MTFRTLHSVTFATVPLIGLLSLHAAATLPTALAAGGLALIALGAVVPETLRQRIPQEATAAIPVVLAVGAAMAIARGKDPVLVAVSFSVALQVLRVATRQGAQHDPQIVVLAILHLVAAAVLGGTLAFGACLVAFTLVVPGALTLSHLRREVERNYEAGAKDRAGRRVDVERILNSKRVAEPKWLLRSLLVAPFVFLFTAALFVVVPRVGLAIFLLKPSTATRMIGFSDAVDLGTMGALTANDALAARVEWTPERGTTPPTLLPFYLRGTAFDAYDGRQWKKTDGTTGQAVLISQTGTELAVGPRAKRPRELVVRLEPLEPPVLFLPNGARSLHFDPVSEADGDVVVHSGPENEWRYEAKQPLALRYAVAADDDRSNPVSSLPPEDRARYLNLPQTLDPRVAELGRTLVGDATSTTEKASRVARHLRSDYRYSTEAPSAGQQDPLAHFLFTSKAGHCEFFSTALAVILRTQGVATRNVTGFVGAQHNAFGNYFSVRQQNAHAWVEYWNPLGESAGRWELLDATPVSTAAPPPTNARRIQELYEALAARWDRHVASFDIRDQARIAQSLANPFDRVQGRLTRAIRGNRGKLGMTATALAMAVAFWLRRRRGTADHGEGVRATPSRTAATDLARSIERALAAGGTRGTHETLREFVERVCPANATQPARELVTSYEAARWGAAELEKRKTNEALRRFENALEAPPTPTTDGVSEPRA